VVGMMTPLGKENSDLSSANYWPLWRNGEN
jgi:hypothetical protein